MSEKIDRLKNLVDQSPHRKEAHFLLAEAYFVEGFNDLALNHYKKAIELDKLFYQAYFNLAKLLFSSDKYDEAMETLNKVIELSPKSYTNVLSVAKLLKSNFYYDEAIQFYKQALLFKNLDYAVFENLGDLYFETENYQKAQMQFRKAIDLNIKKLSLYVKHAYCYYLLGEPDKSIEILKAGVKIDNESVEIHYLLAKIYLEINRLEDYSHELELLSRLDPNKANELKGIAC